MVKYMINICEEKIELFKVYRKKHTNKDFTDFELQTNLRKKLKFGAFFALSKHNIMLKGIYSKYVKKHYIENNPVYVIKYTYLCKCSSNCLWK